MSQSTKATLATQAKNVTQHPGQAIIDYQQKWRGPLEMAEVRAQGHLDYRIAEQHLQTALKTIAKVQDQQQVEDVKEEELGMAPSLC
jgi:hypothetical protein